MIQIGKLTWYKLFFDYFFNDSKTLNIYFVVFPPYPLIFIFNYFKYFFPSYAPS